MRLCLLLVLVFRKFRDCGKAVEINTVGGGSGGGDGSGGELGKFSWSNVFCSNRCKWAVIST